MAAPVTEVIEHQAVKSALDSATVAMAKVGGVGMAFGDVIMTGPLPSPLYPLASLPLIPA
jgi:hypothetical protein